MSLFQNVMERGLDLIFSRNSERRTGRGRLPRNRRARYLSLEALENRKLLSVSPYVPPAVESPAFATTAIVATIESGETTQNAEPVRLPATERNDAVIQADVASDNTAPIAVDDAFSMATNQQLGSRVLANDYDADGDTLSVSLATGASYGHLTLSPHGLFTYRPDKGFSGVDQFTYTVSDGRNQSAPATVTIEVAATSNQVPVALDDAYTMNQGESISIDASSGLLANDADADGDLLTSLLVDAPSHGTLTMGEDGTFTYTPDENFHGTDTFTYVASDGKNESSLATVAITVSPVNDAPLATDDAYTIGEDGVLTIDAAAGVLANDSDVDGDALTATLVDGPSHGTVTLAADGSFQYTPEADFSGADSFTYLAGDGLAQSNLATVAITVSPVNDAPVATDDAYTIGEDGVLTIDAAAGVLANDSDVDGDALTATLVDGPSHGTVTLAADGSFQYTPEADFNGADSFTYLAGDGTAQSSLATVAITVEPVNDAPVASDDAYTIGEDGVLTIDAAAGVLANDSDIDGDTLTATLVDGPSHGTVTLAADGSFQYTPEADFNGADSFTYLAGDGAAQSNLATVSVEVIRSQLAIDLRVTAAPFGAGVDGSWAGSTFWVSAFVQDSRDVPAGVIGGAIDLTYDGLSVSPTGEVAYGEAFNLFQQGEVDASAGMIDEMGALTGTPMVGAGEAAPFVAWQFVRVGAPTSLVNTRVEFSTDPGEGSATIEPGNFALAGLGAPVDWLEVEMGKAGVDLALADFNSDERVDHFDLALLVPRLGPAAMEAQHDSFFDLDGDSLIDGRDLDVLTQLMYREASPQSGLAASDGEERVYQGDDTDLEPQDELGLRGNRGASEPDRIAALDDLFAAGRLWS